MCHTQRRFLSHILIIAVVAMAIFPSTAQAYIDPGSGSLVWQVLIAALLTMGYVVRKYWRRLTRRQPDEDPDDEIHGSQQDERD